MNRLAPALAALLALCTALPLAAKKNAVERAADDGSIKPAVPLPASVLVLDGAPTEVISDAQRGQLGIKNGPDCPALVWNTRDQKTYLLFSGALLDGNRGSFRVPVDPLLKGVAGPLSRKSVEVVLQPGRKSDFNPAGAKDAQGRYTGFDADYSGGGSLVDCPSAPYRTLYFYHGENHTDPTGKFNPGPEQGWTGLGMAWWDPKQNRFVKEDQILGQGVSNRWVKTAKGYFTKQTPPGSGVPSGFYKPEDGYIYVYYIDRTDEMPYAGKGLECDKRGCTAVARAKAEEVCANLGTGRKTEWKKFHRGGFTEPGVFRAGGAGEQGAGGRFTPAVPRENFTGENIPNISYIPSRKLYAMVSLRRPDGSLIVRYSSDGFQWSVQSQVVGSPPKGVYHTYPRLQVLPGATADTETLVMTYTSLTLGEKYENAQLIRQPLRWSGS